MPPAIDAATAAHAPPADACAQIVRLLSLAGVLLGGETLTAALEREVLEETGLVVVVGRLLYVADVVLGATVHDVNLLFLAESSAALDGCFVAGRDAIAMARILPPLLETIFYDMERGWVGAPRYLGNIYASGMRPAS